MWWFIELFKFIDSLIKIPFVVAEFAINNEIKKNGGTPEAKKPLENLRDNAKPAKTEKTSNQQYEEGRKKDAADKKVADASLDQESTGMPYMGTGGGTELER